MSPNAYLITNEYHTELTDLLGNTRRGTNILNHV